MPASSTALRRACHIIPAVPLKLRYQYRPFRLRQALCADAAVTGRFYLRPCGCFLPSGSGATANGLFPRLAPTAASLAAEIPLHSPSQPVWGSLPFSPPLVNRKAGFYCSISVLPPASSHGMVLFRSSCAVRISRGVILNAVKDLLSHAHIQKGSSGRPFSPKTLTRSE